MAYVGVTPEGYSHPQLYFASFYAACLGLKASCDSLVVLVKAGWEEIELERERDTDTNRTNKRKQK